VIDSGSRLAWRWLLAFALPAGLAWALWQSAFRPDQLLSTHALDQAARFLAGCWPPRSDADFLLATLRGAGETLAVAVLGTLLALAIGLPLGLLASRAVAHGAEPAAPFPLPWRVAWLGARTCAALLRSVPEVIWAVVLVPLVGLGPTAGVLALGVAYGGMLAKVYAEQLESAVPAAPAALAAAGAERLQTALWGWLPQAAPGFAAYATYRFECAVRASALMGYVGGGGLGMQLEISFGYSHYGEVATQVLALIALVAVVEVAADALLRRLR
jgi:phosphonate transport system permease protein